MTHSEILEELRAFVCGHAPSEELADLLMRHGCGYLLPDGLPQEERILNRIAVTERYRICRSVFERIRFPYAVVKGAVLSERMHGDPFARASGDVDLLIRRQDADSMKALLLSEGFVQGRVTDGGIVPFTRQEILFQTAMSHQTAPYIKQTGHPLCPYVNVDVNLDVLWGECEARGDMELVLSHGEEASLLGVSLRRLSPEMELVALCLHHYKDMNSLYLLTKSGLRLKPLFDVYLYLKNVRPAPDGIQRIAEALGVGDYLYVCIAHAHEIFADEISASYLGHLAPLGNTELLNSFGLNASERKQWKLSLPERLFHPSLATYVLAHCSEGERKKIEFNNLLM
ncbi:MAG: nucleotidyltransferase family protein [Clostridia bacterium]|nr:nucleotidyltransferase family protein [Clostridia bacterium]